MNAFLDLDLLFDIVQVVVSRINKQLDFSARQDLHLDLSDVIDKQEQQCESIVWCF